MVSGQLLFALLQFRHLSLTPLASDGCMNKVADVALCLCPSVQASIRYILNESWLKKPVGGVMTDVKSI